MKHILLQLLPHPVGMGLTRIISLSQGTFPATFKVETKVPSFVAIKIKGNEFNAMDNEACRKLLIQLAQIIMQGDICTPEEFFAWEIWQGQTMDTGEKFSVL